MPRIRILSEILSNKIAAGEVVERPASVVKELLENAIDAGASRITVAVEQGGRTLIRISDDGIGMNQDDALLCLERFATSKLHDEAGLFSISTLGFRGEALPSIASVSEFTLVTRPASEEAGTRITVSGGRIKDVKPAGAPVGTTVEVRRLFFNIPARRKFLKTVATETGHIVDMITAFALSRHDIHFVLQHNGQTVKNWPLTDDPAARISAVLGGEAGEGLHPVSFSDDCVTIKGWISSPRITRRTAKRVHLFVNGRVVQDRGLQFALFEGYQGRLVKGAFPVATLFFEVPLDRVDVNVHPTKSTVRFVDQRLIYERLKRAVAAVWSAQTTPPWERPAGSDTRLPPDMPRLVADQIAPFPARPRQMVLTPGAAPTPSGTATDPLPSRADRPGHPAPAMEPPQSAPATPFFSSLNIVGQFHHTYIVAESDREIVLIDQHAAHERIVFENLKRRRSLQQTAGQRLLVPETVELSFQEAAALESLLEDFGRLGFDIEGFGGNTFIIKTVPEILADIDVVPLIEEVAGKLAETGLAPDMASKIDDALHVMACHGAIRANRRLTGEEMQALLVRLDACENPRHCPHGRPTAISWRLDEIERLFKRIL